MIIDNGILKPRS